jgi:hypothetical protein
MHKKPMKGRSSFGGEEELSNQEWNREKRDIKIRSLASSAISKGEETK